MRGLAFPSNAVYNREASYDGSPRRNDADAIPIDPALSGSAFDPATTEEESGINKEPAPPAEYDQQTREPQYSHASRQYSQGPQGDPFAPQPPAPYLPLEEDPAPSSKPVKRKRRAKREEECGFCQGNDSKNKDSDPEPMISCEECGRSGHPSCMELGEVSDVVRSYPWRCIECKICEICQEKGDDNRILFCDFCDRGWHMDCLQPPLEDSPPGRWHCPMCPPLVEGPDGMEYYRSPGQESEPVEEEPEESMDPSSSRSHPYKRKGKQKVIAVEDSDVDMDEDDGGDSPVNQSRRRKKSYNRGRAKGRRNSDDDETSSPASPKRPRLRATSPTAPRPRMVVRIRLPAKGKGKGREDSLGPQKGLFDDILGVDDRDTMKTTVEFVDKQRFERSRLNAEEKQVPPPPPLPAPEVVHTLNASLLFRPLRSSTLQHITMPATASTPGMSASPAPSTPGPSSAPVASPHSLRIRTIRFGEFDIQTWYDAPFPEEYANISDGRLWICEFCLKYMKSRFGAVRHRMKCKARHPPGDEIYRDGAISVFEVDGRKNKIYCQNLCLLSKMFLDHKSLFYDVEPFLFYVMTEVDDSGARFVGYFSKEKRSPKDYNVSCIMTLPVRQRQGWGNLLIDFSYLLSKKEQRAGSPEKPLSGLGALGYKNYWTLALMRYLDSAPEKPSLEDIRAASSMTIEDIYTTLTQQNMISSREVTPPPVRPSPGQSIKFPKGRKHGIARRHLQRTQTNDDVDTTPKAPFSPPTQYEIRWDRESVSQYLATWEAKGYLKLKPEKLKWSPFLLARMKKTEDLQTLAIESSATVDPVTSDITPVTTNSPSTPQNDARQPSVSIFDDNAVASGSREPLEANFQQDQGNGTDLPIFGSQGRAPQSPPDEAHDIPRLMRPLSRAKGSTPTSNHVNGESAVHKPFPRGHHTRSDSARASALERSLAEDEALAAKLALEERRSSRSLRARPDRTPDLRQTMSSASVTRPSSPRKRRRVESSPESESGLLGTPINGTPSQRSNGLASSPRHQRKTSQLLNGSGVGHDTSHPAAPLSSRMNVVPLPSTAKTLNKAEDAVDVKSEAATTPLTALTSRHSLPSDDTLIVAEAIDGKQSADPGNAGPVSETLERAEGETTVLADEDVDADADADEDLDAEGEIDAEGDLDVEVVF